MRADRSFGSDRLLARLQGERVLGGASRGTRTRFELLADAVDCAMFLLDETGRVRSWNAGAERITGYASGEVVGEHVSVLYRDEDVEAGVPDRELREAATEGHHEGEGWRVREDGSAFRADVTVAALREEGELAGYATVVRESGGRGGRERTLLDRTERLEDLVATISHDLRNPLAVAQGNAELAAETGEVSRLEETVRALERATELLDYLERLATEDDRAVEPEPVELREMARAAWRDVRTDGATLEVEGSAAFAADRQRLRQLLGNLFANAVEHGSPSNRARPDDAVEHGSTSPRSHAREDSVEHGSASDREGSDGGAGESPAGAGAAVGRAGPGVTVRVGPLESARGFFVEDDGPGIPEADRTEVFEMGYTTDPDGTGFGLAICERAAEAQGWSIDVTDGADGGARFEVSVGDPG